MKRFIIMLLTLVFLCSCSQKLYMDRPNSELIAEGEAFMAKKKYKKAVNNFRTAILNAEDPAMNMKVQLLLAEAYFMNKKYIEAIAAYEVYNDMYRRTPDTPFVIYRLGKSYSKVSKHPRRDPTFTIEALEYFDQLKLMYPAKFEEYGAQEDWQKMRYKLAEHEYQVAKYYSRVREPKSIIMRCETLLKDYPDSPRVEDAHVLMIKAYLKMPDALAAQAQLQKLKLEYPENKEISSLTRKVEKKLKEGN